MIQIREKKLANSGVEHIAVLQGNNIEGYELILKSYDFENDSFTDIGNVITINSLHRNNITWTIPLNRLSRGRYMFILRDIDKKEVCNETVFIGEKYKIKIRYYSQKSDLGVFFKVEVDQKMSINSRLITYYVNFNNGNGTSEEYTLPCNWESDKVFYVPGCSNSVNLVIKPIEEMSDCIKMEYPGDR